MANNRMILIHRPTGYAIILGKHMGLGWYGPPSSDHLQVFYDFIEDKCLSSDHNMEDFCVGMESCSVDTPFVYNNWDGYHDAEDAIKKGGIFNVYSEEKRKDMGVE